MAVLILVFGLFQGVHTSPKGLVSSSGFVFGENLADRVVQRSISEELAEDGSASPDSTEITNAGRRRLS